MVDIFLNGIVTPAAITLFPVYSTIFILWSLVWKGFALWRAVEKRSKPWFIVLLAVNSLGLLDILYLFVFSKMPFRKNVPSAQQ